MSRAETLAGRTILVTRAKHQAQELVELLASRDAQPLSVPVMRLETLVSPDQLREMKGGISAGRWDDAVFTSSNAVRLGLRQRRGAGRARIFAIGPGMAAAAAATGWPVEPLPGSFVVESLAETLLEQWVGGRRVLLLGAVGAREVPHELLRRAGAGRQVDPLPGWSRRKARGPPWSGRWPSQAWTALSLPVAARLGASGPFQERSRLPPRWWLPASGRSSPALLGTPGWSVRWSPRALDPGVVAALEARFGRARENGRQP